MHRSGSRELLPRTEVMTFTTDGTCMVKMEYLDEQIPAVLNESRQERKRLRKLGKVVETVAAYRLKESKHFQAMEKLATWRRIYGYDRDDSWMHGPRPLAPEQFTASLWKEVKALKEAISMSGRARPWQKAKEFLTDLSRGQRASRMKNSSRSNGSWKGEATIWHMRLWRRLIQHSTVTPDRRAPKYRPVHVFVQKRTKRIWWTRSKISSNLHRPVRVLKHPDSNVTQTGRLDEPPPPAS